MLTCDDTFRHLGEPPPPGGAPDDPARMVGNGATAGLRTLELNSINFVVKIVVYLK